MQQRQVAPPPRTSMTYSTQFGAIAAKPVPKPFSPSDIAELLRQVNGSSNRVQVLVQSPQLVVLFVPPAQEIDAMQVAPGETALPHASAAKLLRRLQTEGSANAASFGAPPTDLASHPIVRDLTAREIDVLRLIAKGFQAPQVASVLSLSAHTVRGYVRDVYRKLGISSRAEATMEAMQRGLVR